MDLERDRVAALLFRGQQRWTRASAVWLQLLVRAAVPIADSGSAISEFAKLERSLQIFLLDFQRVTCFPGFHSSLSQTQETERHVSLASWGGAPRAHLRGRSLSTSNCIGSQGTRALQHFPAQCPPRTHFSEAGSSSPHPSFSSILYLSTQSSYHLFLDLTGLLSLSCNPGFPGRRQ